MNDYEGVERADYIAVALGDQTVYVQAVELDGEQEVAGRLFQFDEFTRALNTITEGITSAIGTGLRGIKPGKVALEFGCEVGLKSGHLTAILVEGTAKANLKVTLEWTPGAAENNTPNGS